MKRKPKLPKKLHDELANNVFHSMTFAETQDLTIPEKRELLLDELDKIYAQVRNISKENSPIDTGEKFFKNLIDMLSDFNSNSVKVIINNNYIDWEKHSTRKKDCHSQNLTRIDGEHEKTQSVQPCHDWL